MKFFSNCVIVVEGLTWDVTELRIVQDEITQQQCLFRKTSLRSYAQLAKPVRLTKDPLQTVTARGPPCLRISFLLTRTMTANHTTSSTNNIRQDLEAMQVNSNLQLPTHSVIADGLAEASSVPSSNVSLRVPKDGDSPTRKRQHPEDKPEEDSVVVNKMARPSLSVPDTKNTPL